MRLKGEKEETILYEDAERACTLFITTGVHIFSQDNKSSNQLTKKDSNFKHFFIYVSYQLNKATV